MAQRIQWRRGTAAEATAANPILAEGEAGFETDTGLFKIGDGVTAWNALDYAGGGGGDVAVPGGLDATGTPSSSTFLRGDGTWATPAGGGGGDLLAANNLSDLTNAGTARTNLGLAAVYQPLDSDLTAIAALTTTSFGRAFLALADAAAGRTALGLGTAATTAASAYEVAGAAAAAQAASQPLDSDLTAIAALTTTSYGRSLLAAADAAALRTLAGTVPGTDVQAYDADLAAIAALTSAANKGLQATGTNTWALYDLTTAGKALLDDADAAAQRTTLGLGTAAVAATGDFATAAQGTTADGAVPKSLYDAQSIVVAVSDNTPVVQAVAASRIVGRKATGDITAMTGAETGALIKLDEHAAPTDVTTLNATTSAHGLLPKLSNVSSEYLSGTGVFSTPAGGGGATALGFTSNDAYLRYTAPGLTRIVGADPLITLTSGTTYYFGPYETATTFSLDALQTKIYALTGTANIRLAVIACTPSTWQVGAATYTVAEQTYTTTGEKTITFATQSIAAGAYYIGMKTDNSTVQLSGIRAEPRVGLRALQQGYVGHMYLTVAEAYAAFGTPTAWTTVVAWATQSAYGASIPIFWRVA